MNIRKVLYAMDLNIKLVHENAKMPEYQSEGAVGMDLVAADFKLRQERTGPVFEYDTGVAIEVPEGFVGLVFPRSSITTKTTLYLGNSVGVIDSDYRGTIKFQFRRSNDMFSQMYEVGDRIGQLVIVPAPKINLKKVDELSDTNRGTNGFGSTGA